MKIANRFAMSHTILVVLMAGVLTCQIVMLRQMQASNARNAGQNFRIAVESLSLMRSCDAFENSTRRYFASPSTELQNELKETQESFAGQLASLPLDLGSDKTRLEAERLGRFLEDFRESLTKTQPLPQKPDIKTRQPGSFAVPAEMEEQIERLRAQTSSLYYAGLQTLNQEAESARRAGARALTVLWVSALIALIAGTGISFLVVRSVASPLGHLAEGTRALSEGKEFYRLDTSRSDELSQIAKDFNTLVRRLKSGNTE